jgi:putative nucleotidyltransferase with HDIG domain
VTRRQALIGGATAVICTVTLLAALTSEHRDWQPVDLVVLLFALAVGSDRLTVEVRGLRISGSFLAIVLAMALLGPAPAVAIGAGCTLIDALVARRPLDRTMANIAAFAAFPLVGGVIIESIAGEVEPGGADALAFAGLVLVIFMVTNFLNFLMAALTVKLLDGASLRASVRYAFVPVLPSEFATGLLTAGVAFSYGRIGLGAVGLLAVVVFVFQYLLGAVVQAHERGEELERRTRELASLQVGLLSTVLQTLSMRDAMTARHSAAVARYSREVARMMELPERDQELIHTAALLHDIGKFIFPDSILFADRKLTDDEWEIVKLHPEQGARLLRRIEGYGPIAEIVHAHHERFGGGGYPLGVTGEDIPIGARIIAAADTYDVMTSRDSYRRPVSSEAALAELKRVAGTQLDPIVVDTFTAMILERRVEFRHSDEADFERELAFDNRVSDYARPRAAVA